MQFSFKILVLRIIKPRLAPRAHVAPPPRPVGIAPARAPARRDSRPRGSRLRDGAVWEVAWVPALRLHHGRVLELSTRLTFVVPRFGGGVLRVMSTQEGPRGQSVTSCPVEAPGTSARGLRELLACSCHAPAGGLGPH